MKTQKGEMYGVERVGDRRSQAILAQDFSVKNGAQRTKREEDASPKEKLCGLFIFAFPP
jgi:hypothetical protein